MNKKILLSVILLTALVFSFNTVFAADNMANDAANTVNDSMNKTGNTVENIGNGMRDAGNAAMNAAGDAVNGTMNAAGDAVNELTQDRANNTTATHNNDTDMLGTTNNNGNYTANRTAAEGTILGMDATTWTWVIMGIVGIAIIALVWYYSMQHDTVDGDYDD